MFDWNDEELVNIIWGEADESDDHIVPYPDGSEGKPPNLFGGHIKKEWNEESSNLKPTESKIPFAKSEISGGKQKKNSQDDANEGLPVSGLGVDSCVDLSLSNDAKPDQDSMDEPAELNNDSETFQNRHEDKYNSDLVDYDWANIGSFDDLDRIFCNGDPVFEHVSLGNADELWSSSKGVTSSPDKSVSLSIDSPSLGCTALRSTSKHYGKAEFMLDQDQPPTPGYEKVNDLTCNVPQNVQTDMDHLGNAGIKNKIFMKDKVAMEMVSNSRPFNSNLDAGTVAATTEYADKMSRKRKCLKSRKKSEDKNEARPLQDLFSNWSLSGNQFLQLQGPESLQYKHFSTPLLAPLYTNVGNRDPAISVLPWFHSGEGNRKVPCGSEVSSGNSNPLNTFPEIPVNPLAMTPQEKIEKLRRRQKMRAMLAIQKQLQQFTHQTSSSEHSISQKYTDTDQMQLVEGGNFEVSDYPNTLPFLDPNSPAAQDDCSTISMAIDNCSLEEAILYRLQDIVAKLDIQLRLCIRDSLFRLAQSAMQRQYAKDTSSTNTRSNDDLEFLAKEANNNRFDKMTEVETNTNTIDRTVAHLLFHRPLELLGKLPETLESPASARLPCERKATSLLSSPSGVWPENFETKETRSHLVSKSPVFSEGEKSKSSSRVNNSENASNCEAECGATEAENS